MKSTDSFIKFLFPNNWLLFIKNMKSTLKNFVKYNNLSFDINSPAYFDEVYSKENFSREPFHYYYISKYLPNNKSISICDFGCGVGEGIKYISDKFPNAIIEGIDYSKNAIEKAKNMNPNVKLYQLDITKDKLPHNYDYILCVETLEHFRNPHKIIKELLKYTNYKLIISVPYTEDKENVGKVSFFAKHLYNFNEESLNNIKGAEVLTITDYIPSTKSKCIIYEITK